MFNLFRKREKNTKSSESPSCPPMDASPIEENIDYDYIVSQDLFPGAESNGLGSLLIRVESLVKNGTFVKKGQPIMHFRDISPFKNYYIEVVAKYDGYYSYIGDSDIPKIGSIICSTYLSMAELISKRFQTDYSISHDVFTGNKTIQWQHVFGNQTGIDLDSVIIIYSSYNNQPSIRLQFLNTIEKGSVKMKIGGGDKLLLLLSNKDTLEFSLPKPIKVNDYIKECCISLSLSDIERLKSAPVFGIRLSKKDSDVCIDLFVGIDGNVWSVLYDDYMTKYLSALGECGIDWKSKVVVEQKVTEKVCEECYVYLMHDTTNNAYKIGISNNPHYREHTLQSEKPFIELLGYKLFPTRKIAAAFESALHEAYDDKHIRGEWFYLDSEDVNHLLDSLK